MMRCWASISVVVCPTRCTHSRPRVIAAREAGGRHARARNPWNSSCRSPASLRRPLPAPLAEPFNESVPSVWSITVPSVLPVPGERLRLRRPSAVARYCTDVQHRLVVFSSDGRRCIHRSRATAAGAFVGVKPLRTICTHRGSQVRARSESRAVGRRIDARLAAMWHVGPLHANQAALVTHLVCAVMPHPATVPLRATTFPVCARRVCRHAAPRRPPAHPVRL